MGMRERQGSPRSQRNLANHVIEVSGINDAGVQALMQNAAGLITVSMTEGFGLRRWRLRRLAFLS